MEKKRKQAAGDEDNGVDGADPGFQMHGFRGGPGGNAGAGHPGAFPKQHAGSQHTREEHDFRCKEKPHRQLAIADGKIGGGLVLAHRSSLSNQGAKEVVCNQYGPDAWKINKGSP